jgi:hypothetical protein
VSDEAATPGRTEPDLLDLPFEELRERAFQLAEERHDYAFF